jgi:hypothetical protein
MGTWNYRIIKHDFLEQECYTVHSAHYENNRLVAYSAKPSDPFGLDLSELKSDLEKMLAAHKRPVLSLASLSKKFNLQLNEEEKDFEESFLKLGLLNQRFPDDYRVVKDDICEENSMQIYKSPIDEDDDSYFHLCFPETAFGLNLKQLKKDIKKMIQATKMPIIKLSDFYQ